MSVKKPVLSVVLCGLQEECNTFACNFDGQECSFQSTPYQNCSAVLQGIQCWDVFQNGHCDKACSSEECLFDGFDCNVLKECNPIYNNYCTKYYADGHCDEGCNNAECNYDGLDCDPQPPRPLDGSLVIVLLMPVGEFLEKRVHFVRTLGHILHTVVSIAKDSTGNDMIYHWQEETARKERSVAESWTDGLFSNRAKRAAAKTG